MNIPFLSGFLILIICITGTAVLLSQEEMMPHEEILLKAPVQYLTEENISIAYREIGRGPPVILIMGLGGSMNEWDRTFLSHLASRHHLILPDNRGIGDSTGGELNCSIPDMAGDIIRLMDHLRIPQADLLGFSMGTMIALQVAESNPEKIHSLILYGTDNNGTATIERLDPYYNQPGEGLIKMEAFFPEKWLNEQQDLSKVFPPSIHPTNKAAIERQKKAIKEWNISQSRISAIRKPVMIMVGTEDIITPVPAGKYIAELINESEVYLISDGGHSMLYQYPEILGMLSEAFLFRHERSK